MIAASSARRAARFAHWIALFAAFAGGACDSEPREVVAATQVTLTITSDDPALRDQLDELRAELWLIDAGGRSLRSRVAIAGPELRWPLDIPIIPSRREDESAAFEVLVEGWAGGTRVITARASGQFRPGAHETLSLSLRREADADGRTGEPDAGTREGAPNDAGSDAGAAARDSGSAATEPGADAAAGPGTAPTDAAVAPPTCPADACVAPYTCVPTTQGYTCRGQFADWPMPDGNAGAKTAPSYSSDTETVTDNVTKLVWQLGIPTSYPNCATEEGAAFCTRQDATRYCEQLVHGGYEDWRLPSLIELVSLFHTERGDNRAGIDVGYFGDTENYLFVSSSVQANAPSQVWKVNYWQRRTYAYDVPYGRVRCVRGGAEPPFATPADRYQIDADTVTDRATGLIWQRSVSDTRYAPDEFANACPAGFRLPRPNELLSLVDPTRAEPAIDPVAFPNTPSDLFWVSPFTAVASEYAVSFASGELDYFADTAYLRCVR